MSNFIETFKEKWPTYFFEIIVIILGILGAFALDNWNEERKNIDKEEKILLELETSLTTDLEELNDGLTLTERYLNSNQIVLKHIENRLPFHDSLKFHFAHILGYTIYTPDMASFENLKAIGLDIIQDDTLRNALSKLYTVHYGYYHELEKNWDQLYQKTRVIPQIESKLITEELWSSARPLNMKSLHTDHEFKEVVRLNVWNKTFLKERTLRLRDRIEFLLKRLKNRTSNN